MRAHNEAEKTRNHRQKIAVQVKLGSKRRGDRDPGEEDHAERPAKAKPPDILPPDADKIRLDKRKSRVTHARRSAPTDIEGSDIQSSTPFIDDECVPV